MSFCLIVAGATLLGYQEMPAQINGAYGSSCDTSYCRAAQVHYGPQAATSSILNRPTGHGYSVDYNYGLEPQPVAGSWSGASGSGGYNHGGYRMK